MIVLSVSLSLATAEEPRSFTVQYLIISAPKSIALAKRADALRVDDLDRPVREMFHDARTGRVKVECFENMRITPSEQSFTSSGANVRYATDWEQPLLPGSFIPPTRVLVRQGVIPWQALVNGQNIPTTFEVKDVGHKLTIDFESIPSSKLRFSITERSTAQLQSETPRYGAGLLQFERIKVVPRFGSASTTQIVDAEPNRWTFVSFHNNPGDNTRADLHFFRYISKLRP